MVKLEKFPESSGFLNAAACEKLRVTEVRLESEGEFSEFSTQDGKQLKRYIIDVSFQGQRPGDPTKLSLGKRAFNAFVDALGDQSERWRGATVPLKIEGSEPYRSVTLDELRLKKD